MLIYLVSIIINLGRRRHPSVLGDDGVVPGWVSGICGGSCVARPVNGSLSGTLAHI